METTSALTTGFTLDELRVEELEPRLEFDTFQVCSYALDASGNCGVIQTFEGGPDFAGRTTQIPCPGA